MKQIFKPIFPALLVSLFALSCVKEQFREAGLEEGEGWLMVNFGPQESIEVTTKATQNATSENSVSNIYVFLFDKNGNKLYGKWLTASEKKSSATVVVDASTDCWYVDNTASPVNGCFKIKASAGNGFKLYVISNLDSDMARISSDLLSHSIVTENDLKNFKLQLNQETVNRNTNFPMVAYKDGISIEAGKSNTVAPSSNPLHLQRIDAKVRFVFKTGTRPDERGQRIKSFEARQWKVVNVPTTSYVVPRIGEDATVVDPTTPSSEYASKAPYFFETDWRNFEDITTSTQEFSFYMLENRQSPKNSSFTSYQDRSRQVKDAAGKNETVNVEYTSLLGKSSSRELRLFQNANDFSTYVLVTGRVNMDLENDDAGQTLGADVQYMIHLGNWSSTIHNGTGEQWSHDEYSNVTDFNTERNHSYTYTVTINSVNNIRVEVEKGDTENQPGSIGEVIIAKEEIALCDAHYVSKTMTFHAKHFVTAGSDGSLTSTADRLTWKVKTPYCDGSPIIRDGIDIADHLDYRWVHFRLNKQDDGGNYFQDRRRKFTTRVFEHKELSQENKEDDGTEGLAGYHNDGCMDIIQLVSYIKDQVEKYVKYYNKCLEESNAGRDPSAVVNTSDFDNGYMADGVTEDPDGPKICVTTFVDEYYYDEHPITHNTSPTLWKTFVNQDDRTMHILCDSNSSTDLESTSTGSVITIQQHSIKSIYNTNTSYTALQTAWGIETTDEFSDKVKKYNSSESDYSDSGQNTAPFNGRANSVFEWGLAPDGVTVETITDVKPDVSWGTFLNYEVDNDTPLMKSTPTDYQALRYFCMARNRDNNGDGVIQKEEIRWYLASVQQLVGLFVGTGVVEHSSRLYYRTAAQQASNEKNDWCQLVISSTSGGSSPIVIWGHEGISTSTYAQSNGWSEWQSYKNYGIRCVRNLGLEPDADIKEKPDDYVSITSNADGSYTFECTHLNDAALRDYTSVDLPYADQFSSTNRLYKRFEVYSDYTTFSSTGFDTFQSKINQDGSAGSGYCPEGYRVPNQMELAMMNYYISLSGNLYSRTYYSFGPLGMNKVSNKGFMRLNNGNITVDASTEVTTTRCVRDIRVE
ncbi:MAG: fimbrial protein [Candidatus Cryptobacteroides sp.]